MVKHEEVDEAKWQLGQGDGWWCHGEVRNRHLFYMFLFVFLKKKIG